MRSELHQLRCLQIHRKLTGEMLAISRIAEIHKAILNTHLVMHGSSSVSQKWLEMINKPACKYMKQVCIDRYQQFWAAVNAIKI